MPSFLMPNDTNDPLDQKLMALVDDANHQYNALTKLNIPEKAKIIAQKELNDCLEKLMALPQKESIAILAGTNPADDKKFHHLYRGLYLKFLTFYSALECVLVCHYLPFQFWEGNDYLKEALAKLPAHEVERIKSIAAEKRSDSPHTPRSEGSPRKETSEPSPRKRGASHAITPLSWLKSAASKLPEQKNSSPRNVPSLDLKE